MAADTTTHQSPLHQDPRSPGRGVGEILGPAPIGEASAASTSATVSATVSAATRDRLRAYQRQAAAGTSPPTLDVVIPVYNEERDLAASVRRLHAFLEQAVPYSFRITVADNASTDRTPQIAAELAHELSGVTVRRLAQKGRGRALRSVWTMSDAPVLVYMDVDLSTDLGALLPLVAPLISGHSDLAIGTRLARGSRVVRGPKREFISRSYNLILRTALSARFSDAQCGFKAIRAEVAQQLLPLVEDTGWFFDTELLVLAERAGLRIHEVPVDWVDDPDSTVDIVATARADLRGVWRVGRALADGKLKLPLSQVHRLRTELRAPQEARTGLTGQILRFAAVGVASTAFYLVLYSVLRGLGGGAQAANALALLFSAFANTAANRVFTFGERGGVLGAGAGRQQAQGLLVFLLGLVVTSGSLLLLHGADPGAGRATELSVLIAANLAATLLRFVLFRTWIFRSRRSAD